MSLLWGCKRTLTSTTEADGEGRCAFEKANAWPTDGGIKSLLETYITSVVTEKKNWMKTH